MRTTFDHRFWVKLISVAIVAATIMFATVAVSSAEVRLTGSGATFPFPIYSTWFKDYNHVHKDVQINYQGKGSGAGIKDLQNHTVDFAGSDAAMTDEEIAQVKEGVQLLPMTAGSIVLAYNLPGDPKDLKLSREAYSKIFLAQIKKWNDPLIAKDNPGMKLPDLDITVVRRADASGTNFVFTKHLSAINEDWAKGPGQGLTVKWPESNKIVAAPKNDGVTATIRQTPGAIGYIEYGYAIQAKVRMALLQNKEGKFVAPSAKSGSAALSHVKLPADMRAWLPDPEGDQSYPIATYTWMLFYKKYQDPKKAAALRDMVAYCLKDGQKISDKMGYIPLPENVVQEVLKASDTIQ
ncbi:MAG TPA: phosphate ABC transporter substrate-binding protein PstS [Desulfomonilaceae bacterium]|nr:phosphate ABC transporter substrate-binding protein PstS [Desulfomonilaceae bacterium]